MKTFSEENIEHLKGTNGERYLELLYKKYYTELCRASYKYTGNGEAAEEIVQDVFVSLWNKRYEINITISLKSYIYKSVINTSLNYIKSKFARNQQNEDSINGFDYGNSTTEEALDKKELEEILYKAINELPDRCREIFSLNRFAGLTQKEISEKLNISIKTVETQITKALKRLKTEINKYGYLLPIILGIIVF
ncbi:RNA polymerase sigma-70 factor [Bacteroidota bacterium]